MSRKRFVVILAGSQSGKTSWGPFWLREEMRLKGPGDYMVVTPTYPLLQKKLLPEFLRLFRETLRMGEYNSQEKIFRLSAAGQASVHGAASDTPTKVFFGHAQDPDSLESATAKAAWLDEAGQNKFKIGSWEAIQRRLTIHQGRILITTTPYTLGWLKQRLYDPWVESGRNHPLIDVIQFDSTRNPAFPREEYERLRRELPAWKFDMMMRGLFTRMAGLIYDCFDAKSMTWPWQTRIPPEWPRRLGLDFGAANTAGVFLAEEHVDRLPSGRWIAYREHRPGQRLTPEEHAAAMLEGEPRTPACWGGSKSEGDWRERFRKAGLPVKEPEIAAVEPGIDAVYALFKSGRLIVRDDCTRLLDELGSYSRVLDESGEPTEEIDDQNSFHICDALRYCVSSIPREHVGPIDAYSDASRLESLKAPEGVWASGGDSIGWDSGGDRGERYWPR